MADWWDVAGQVIGGGLSWLGARDNADAALQASQQSADAITAAAREATRAAEPWSIGSLGGTAQFDDDTGTGLLNLSPELAQVYQGALTRSGLWGEQALKYGLDPFEAANTFYNQQQEYYQPQEDKLRTDLETRLLAQGRLGSTGGAHNMGQLEEAIGQGQTQRRTQAFSQAQSLINSLLGRESGDIATATGLLDIPLQLSNVGRGIGGNLGGVAAAGLKSRADAAQNLSATMAAGGTGWGNALTGLGGMFTNNFERPKQQPINITLPRGT